MSHSSLAALTVLSLSLLGSAASAQIEHGGAPAALRGRLRQAVPTARMRPVDRAALLAEDAALAGRAPLRFAEVLEVDLGLASAGAWEELGNGDRVWRLRIQSPDAFSLAFVLERFQLPEGGELFVHDDAFEVVRGAYTELENRLDGEFAIQPTRGDALTLEYFEPARSRGRGELELALVVHDYRDVLGYVEKSGSGGGNCEVDVACPVGLGWEETAKSVTRILALPLGIVCSGALLNNTANDGTGLVITSEHCGSLANAVFVFNYQRPGCRDGVAPTTDTAAGSIELAVDPVIDFRLVRLHGGGGAPPFPVHMAGWDRSDVTPARTWVIHHPDGGPKKLSLDRDPPGKTPVDWRIFQWDVGVTEGGSSGSPLFDPEQRCIGILDRGASSCTNPTGDDFFPRLAAMWELLEPYLDPLGTGQLTLDGLDPSGIAPLPFDVTGVVPAQVEALYPGTRKVVRIIGTGFQETSLVAIDAQPLPPEAFVTSGNTFLNVDMPQLHAGLHTFTVMENGVPRSIPFDVVPPGLPRLQADTGDADAPVYSFAGVDLLHADQPGHVHYCYFSSSSVPSVHRLLTLGLGNNFTEISTCRINAIPASGWLRVHHDVAPDIFLQGTTVYSQTACATHGPGPLPTSNLQRSVFQF